MLSHVVLVMAFVVADDPVLKLGPLKTPPTHVYFLDDDKTIAALDQGGTWHAWDVASGKQLGEAKPAPGASSRKPPARLPAGVTADGRSVWSYDVRGRRTTWRPGADATTVKPPLGSPWQGNQFRHDAVGRFVASDIGGAILLTDFKDGRRTPHFAGGGHVSFVAITARGDWLAAAIVGSRVALWPLDKSKPPTLIDGLTGTDSTAALAFSRDSRSLVVLSGEKRDRLQLAEVATLSHRSKPITVAGSEITQIMLAADQRRLIAGCVDGSVRIVDAVTGQTLVKWTDHTNEVAVLSLSRDGTKVVSAAEDGSIVVRDLSKHMPPKIELKPTEAWEDLASKDGTIAHRAGCALIEQADELPELIGGLFEVPTDKEILALIAQLDDPDFNTRRTASRRLTVIGKGAERVLREALKGDISVEGRLRLEQLLKSIKPGESVTSLQGLRAVEILERLGDAKARKLLQQIAERFPDDEIGVAAKESLGRLGS